MAEDLSKRLPKDIPWWQQDLPGIGYGQWPWYQEQQPPSPTVPVKPGTLEAREADIKTIMSWGLSREEAERIVASKPGEGYTIGNIELAPQGGYNVTWTPPAGAPPTTGEGLLAGYPMEYWEYGIPQWQAEQERLKNERISTRQWQNMLAARQAEGMPQSRPMSEYREALRRGFELGRIEALEGLDSPRAWIKRWEIENMPNPYEPLEPQGEPGMFAQEFAEEHGIPVQEAARLGGGFVAGGGGMLKEGELAQLQAMDLGTRQALEWVGAETIGGSPDAPRPTSLDAPAWLINFVPGLTAGQPITKQALPTPSGQLWMKTPESQRQMYAGYADWAGGTPFEDLMSRAAMMAPKPTTLPSRWTPSRQRTAV